MMITILKNENKRFQIGKKEKLKRGKEMCGPIETTPQNPTTGSQGLMCKRAREQYTLQSYVNQLLFK